MSDQPVIGTSQVYEMPGQPQNNSFTFSNKKDQVVNISSSNDSLEYKAFTFACQVDISPGSKVQDWNMLVGAYDYLYGVLFLNVKGNNATFNILNIDQQTWQLDGSSTQKIQMTFSIRDDDRSTADATVTINGNTKNFSRKIDSWSNVRVNITFGAEIKSGNVAFSEIKVTVPH